MTVEIGGGAPPLPPADQRFFEDYPPDAVYRTGPMTIDKDELIAFAKAYDPQRMHVDEAFAVQGPFGGLIASGWQTIGVLMRLFVDNFLSTVANKVSPGCDEVRWLQPVRPGDAITAHIVVLDKRRLRSDPLTGLLRARIEGYNQRGELAASFIGTIFMKCRGPEVAEAPETA